MPDGADSQTRSDIGSGDAGYNSTDIVLGNSAPRKLYYRNKTTDAAVIKQVMGDRQYDLGRLRRAEELKGFLERKRETGKTPLIVDAGANIGVSAMFFATIVADANIVAVEPERENFALLEMNVAGLPVRPIRGAVASTPGLARIIDPGRGQWGYRTENIGDVPASSAAVPRVTVNDIYREHAQRSFPFIVKVDIEGGEADLFSCNTEWVATTPVLIVELHDWMLTGSASSRTFLQCVSRLDRDFVYFGEDVYSIANDLKQ